MAAGWATQAKPVGDEVRTHTSQVQRYLLAHPCRRNVPPCHPRVPSSPAGQPATTIVHTTQRAVRAKQQYCQTARQTVARPAAVQRCSPTLRYFVWSSATAPQGPLGWPRRTRSREAVLSKSSGEFLTRPRRGSPLVATHGSPPHQPSRNQEKAPRRGLFGMETDTVSQSAGRVVGPVPPMIADALVHYLHSNEYSWRPRELLHRWAGHMPVCPRPLCSFVTFSAKYCVLARLKWASWAVQGTRKGRMGERARSVGTLLFH